MNISEFITKNLKLPNKAKTVCHYCKSKMEIGLWNIEHKNNSDGDAYKDCCLECMNKQLKV